MRHADMEAARQQVIRFAKECWLEHRSVPAVRLILKSCNWVNSARHFYELFPGRLSQLCKLAGIPPPVERLLLTEKARSTRQQEHIEASEFRLEAKILEEIGKGIPLPKIASVLGHPDLVLELSKKHARLKEADTGGPFVPKQLRIILSTFSMLRESIAKLEESITALHNRAEEVEGRFSGAFTSRECPRCHARIFVPRFAESYLCSNCGTVLGQTYTEYEAYGKDGSRYSGAVANPPR